MPTSGAKSAGKKGVRHYHHPPTPKSTHAIDIFPNVLFEALAQHSSSVNLSLAPTTNCHDTSV